MFAARPRVALESAGCRKIDLVLNDRPIKTLVLYNGWRDYRIALERDWMTSGNNRLTVNLASGKKRLGPFYGLSQSMGAKPTVTANSLSQIHRNEFAQRTHIFAGMEFSEFRKISPSLV